MDLDSADDLPLSVVLDMTSPFNTSHSDHPHSQPQAPSVDAFNTGRAQARASQRMSRSASASAPPKKTDFSFTYILTLPGIIRLVNLLFVIVSTIISYQIYPLKHYKPSGGLYSYGKMSLDAIKKMTPMEAMMTAQMDQNSNQLWKGEPTLLHVHVNPFTKNIAGAYGYASLPDYVEVMFELYRAHYALNAFVASFVIAFLILMMCNVQAGNTQFTKWAYALVVGGFLAIATIVGAIAASALTCEIKEFIVSNSTKEGGNWETANFVACNGDMNNEKMKAPSMPKAWIAYYISVGLTGFGMLLGMLAGFVFP